MWSSPDNNHEPFRSLQTPRRRACREMPLVAAGGKPFRSLQAPRRRACREMPLVAARGFFGLPLVILGVALTVYMVGVTWQVYVLVGVCIVSLCGVSRC